MYICVYSCVASTSPGKDRRPRACSGIQGRAPGMPRAYIGSSIRGLHTYTKGPTGSTNMQPRATRSIYYKIACKLFKAPILYSRPYPHKFQPTMVIVCLCILLCGQRISSASPGLGKRPRACLSWYVQSVSYTHLTLPTKRIV